MGNGNENYKPEIPVYYSKLIIFGALPILLALADFLFWYINCTINGRDYS
jgi:hypothetical protein